MAAISDYLEQGLLNHLFKQTTFEKPTNISIALTGDVAKDNHTGSDASFPELPKTAGTGEAATNTGYARINLGDPSDSNDLNWRDVGQDNNTEYYVYSEQHATPGYYYPLYLNQSTAASLSAASTGTAYTFPEFPGITLYGPAGATSAGVANPPVRGTLYEGNGFIKNKKELLFPTALTEWGWISGVAILDDKDVNEGNLLMYAQLKNPRYVYIGDQIKFEPDSFEISVK
tara:strand:+ start:421 stop:1110 length:690 start_codon:yes stop_codon:yes gene_type:complete